MRVKLLGNMDDGAVILPVGSVVDLPDGEAQYLASVGAVELVAEAVSDVEEAKPAKRTRAKE